MPMKLNIDTAVYPLEAVYAAAYTFTREAYVEIGSLKKGQLAVTLEPKDGGRAEKALQGEFRNELLHHAFRLKMAERNQALREKIVVQALVSAQPQPASKKAAPQQPGPAPAAPAALDAELEKEIEKLLKEAEGSDYKGDPLGIAVPWEKREKCKKKK